MTTARTDVLWRAGASGLAHASTPRATRTLCGALVTIQRLEHPATNRCVVCDVLARAGAR